MNHTKHFYLRSNQTLLANSNLTDKAKFGISNRLAYISKLIREAFLQNGLEVAFHGVNIKPGRPIMMGKMQNTVVICLPGNPLTAMVNIYLFVIPMLKKLQSETSINHGFIKAVNKKEFKTKSGRVNVVLGKVQNGDFFVTRDNKYGSGMITVLYESNAILVTNEQTSTITLNQEVKLLDFNGKFFEEKVDILN